MIFCNYSFIYWEILYFCIDLFKIVCRRFVVCRQGLILCFVYCFSDVALVVIILILVMNFGLIVAVYTLYQRGVGSRQPHGVRQNGPNGQYVSGPTINPFPHTINLQQTTLKTSSQNTKTHHKCKNNYYWIKLKRLSNGEIAYFEQFLLLQECFPFFFDAEVSESICMWERVIRRKFSESVKSPFSSMFSILS